MKHQPSQCQQSLLATSLAVFTFVSTNWGCSSGFETTGVEMPRFDPVIVAREAVAAYDTNGDSLLSATELENCPAIANNLALYDEDADAHVSAAEIENRIKKWIQSGTGVLAMKVEVLVDNRPLPNATVEFKPLPFFADTIKPAFGTTDLDGAAWISMNPDDVPKKLQGMAVLYPGMYSVSITHEKIMIPRKYNLESLLGCEVSPKTAVPSQPLRFSLKSK